MKRTLIGTAAASLFFLSACGASGPDLAGLCGDMVQGDPNLTGDMGGLGVEDFCACYEATLADASPDVVATNVAVMTAVAEIRDADGLDVEGAASKIMGQLTSDGDAYPFSRTAFDEVGNTFSQVNDKIEDGVCKATG